MKTSILSLFLPALAAATPLVVRDTDTSDHSKHCKNNGTLPDSINDWTEADLYVPVSIKHPDVSFGPTSNPYVTPGDFCTVFHHIIPVTQKGRFCTLKWYLPTIETAPNPYEFVGGGSFQFAGFTYDPTVPANITYNTLPPLGPPIPNQVFQEGNTYTIDGGSCGIVEGQTQPSTIGGMLCSNDTTLGFLASSAKCPIGPFIIFSDTPGYPPQ